MYSSFLSLIISITSSTYLYFNINIKYNVETLLNNVIFYIYYQLHYIVLINKLISENSNVLKVEKLLH